MDHNTMSFLHGEKGERCRTIISIFLVLLNLLLISKLNAANGLLLDLIVPPGEKDRFQHAEFSCWIADSSTTVGLGTTGGNTAASISVVSNATTTLFWASPQRNATAWKIIVKSATEDSAFDSKMR